MKQWIVLSLCLVMCIALVGCHTTDRQNDEAREVLQRVLEKEQTFTSKTSMVSDAITEQTLDQYHFQTPANAYYAFVPAQYAFVDMDNDHIDELVIFDAKMTYYLVLRYDNKKVYGYHIGARSLVDLRTDGSFMTSSAAGINSIGTMSFDGSEYQVMDKAVSNDNIKEYFIDSVKTDQETAKKYFDDWDKNTTPISWITIE